jgi:hypothetical protein
MCLARLDIVKGRLRLLEGELAIDGSAQLPSLDELSDLNELFAACAHKHEHVAHMVLPGSSVYARAIQRQHEGLEPSEVHDLAKMAVGNAGERNKTAAGTENGERSVERVSAQGIEDDVHVFHHRIELLCAVVDHLVGAVPAHEVGAGCARRRRHHGAQMLGELDGNEAKPPAPAWMRMRSPRCTCAFSTIACQAARLTSGSAAASEKLNPRGMGPTSS